MKISEHFNREEFDCKDGTPVPSEYCPNVVNLANELEIIREALGVPLLILSGYRTPKYNKAIGGASKSQHLLAKAADLTTRKHTPKQLHATIEKLIKEKKLKDGGLGLYPGFVHYDIGKPRRWKG